MIIIILMHREVKKKKTSRKFDQCLSIRQVDVHYHIIVLLSWFVHIKGAVYFSNLNKILEFIICYKI
jgi:hypothetical protein